MIVEFAVIYKINDKVSERDIENNATLMPQPCGGILIEQSA